VSKRGFMKSLGSKTLYEDEKIELIAHMMSCTRRDNSNICNLVSKYLENKNIRKIRSTK